jgi:hypothetical protein
MNACQLTFDAMDYRSCSLFGICELSGKIVYVYGTVVQEPPATPTEQRVISTVLIADIFKPDFSAHWHKEFPYKDDKVLFRNYAKCYIENGRLFLNTLKTAPAGDRNYSSAFAKVFEITDTKIREVSPSPRPEEYESSENKTYYFGDYILRMATKWKLECRSAVTDKVIWDMRLTAWLYSELEERNGILYFGTAGQGGHFYGVSLIDGRVIFDWDTGGTTAVIWINDCLAITDRNGDLILLNPADGSEVKRFHVKGMRISAQGLEFKGNFYTSMSDKKEFHKLYAVCLELSENENTGVVNVE